MHDHTLTTSGARAALTARHPHQPLLPTPLWAQQAAQWARIKAPLRPSGEDLVWVQNSLDQWHDDTRRPPAAVVLGATAELAALRWPLRSQVTAIDLSPAMLQGVWLGAPAAPGQRLAVKGNWLHMPFVAGGTDLVLADGSFTLVRQAEARILVPAIRRLLRADGRLILRAYTRPQSRETPESVCAQLVAGQIGSFHVFKFRLLMSLHRGMGEVGVSDAWDFFDKHCPPAETIARNLGWAIDEVLTIEAYRGQDSVYWFPVLEELRAVLEPYFHEVECRWPTYELGDRCPTLVLRPRPTVSGPAQSL